MREAIGGTWLFNIVIFFVILFTGYMCLSINHTKAFNVKDDIVKTIERDGGFSDLSHADENNNTIVSIVRTLQDIGYRSASKCPDANGGQVWFGFRRDGKRTNGDDAAFCIREVDSGAQNPKRVYYQVVVFYQLDLPIFNQLFRFNIKGDTKLLYL